MAQALFEVLTGGVASVSVDNQTTLAVQSLLDSQTIQEPLPVEDDDLFQCGKCKKQFCSLPAFVQHKQQRCAQLVQQPATIRPGLPTGSISANPNSAFTASVPSNLNRQQVSLPSYRSVTGSPIPQGQMLNNQNIVLSEDLIAFANIEQNLQTPNLQLSTQIQGNPFLSQVGPLAQRSTSANGLSQQNVTTYTVSTPVIQTTFANQTTYNAPVSASPIIQGTTQFQTTGVMAATSQEYRQPQPVTMGIQKTSPGKKIMPNNQNQNISVMMLTESDVGNIMQVNTLPATNKRRGNKAESPEDTAKRKLKCHYCEKSFAKNFDLQQHVRSHTGEKPFQCIVCGRAFAQKSNVKKHMQTHKVWPTGSSSTLPKQPIVQQVQEEEPIEEVPDEKTPEVMLKDEEQPEEGVVISVPKEDSNGEPKVSIMIDNAYLCHYCPEKFRSYFHLKTHMIIHKSEQVYKCIVKRCSATFKELDQFLEHTKTHEEDMSYRCHLCNKNFPSLYELGVHQYSHSLYPNQGAKSGLRYFKCNKCNNKYATPEALEHHTATTTHNYPCTSCDKIFTCERYLRRHLITHGEADLVCNVCGKGFRTEHYLKMHMLVHSCAKPHKCDQCGAAFNRKDKLKRHETIHDPSKKFKCPFRTHTGCMKEFNRPDKLKAHIITHSGVKPYKCQECGKTFTRRPHLKDHIRIHKDDYQLRCEVCNKGFARERLLNAHKCRPLPPDGQTNGVIQQKMQEPPPADLNAQKVSLVRKRRCGRPPKKVITVTKETGTTYRRRSKRQPHPKKLYIIDSASEDDEAEIKAMEEMLANSPPPVGVDAEDSASKPELKLTLEDGLHSSSNMPQKVGEHSTINVPVTMDMMQPLTVGIKNEGNGIFEVQVLTQTNEDGEIVQQIQQIPGVTFDVSQLSGQGVQLAQTVPLSAAMAQVVQECTPSSAGHVLGQQQCIIQEYSDQVQGTGLQSEPSIEAVRASLLPE